MSGPMSTKGIPRFVFPKGTRTFVEELGATSMVCPVEANRVLKCALEFNLEGCDEATRTSARHQMEESRWFIAREKQVYQHLGPHEGILHCIDISERGLLFPFMKNGNLRSYLRRQRGEDRPLPLATRLAFVLHALRSIAFIHSRGVLQCDISARNFLVTDDGRSLVLCDFAGSAMQGAEPLVSEETRYRKVQGLEDAPFTMSIVTELFAVGSLIFEIMTDERPYDKISDEEVESRYAKGSFPTVDHVPVVPHVIRDCWAGAFRSANEVTVEVSKATRGFKEDDVAMEIGSKSFREKQ